MSSRDFGNVTMFSSLAKLNPLICIISSGLQLLNNFCLLSPYSWPRAACTVFASSGAVLQVCLFQAGEAAKPQDLAGFQLLNRGHVTCHWSPAERTVGVISFLVNIHPEVNLSPLHICFPSGVFLLLRYPHFAGQESFCSVTYPLKTTKNYFREAV